MRLEPLYHFKERVKMTEKDLNKYVNREISIIYNLVCIIENNLENRENKNLNNVEISMFKTVSRKLKKLNKEIRKNQIRKIKGAEIV